MKDKILLIYNTVIVGSIVLILLSAIQIAFAVINIPKEFPISIGICSAIGLVSFLIDRTDYINKYNE